MGSVALIGFLQALGLVAYITLVATFFQNIIKLFGPLDNFTAPIVMLTTLSVSVLICGFISLGYPIKLFFIKKEYQKALKIVGFTTIFLFVFLALLILGIALLK